MSTQRTVTVYQYPQCGTCRIALKWLKQEGLEVEPIHVFDNPPDSVTLKTLVGQSGLDIRKWFNTSGEVYKEMKLKDKLPQMNEEQMIELLATNGRLIKRPVVTDGSKVTVGFKEDRYEQIWGGSTGS
ncbi:arsenate reductase family protein [Paenibacillus piri]|uniref:Arsenate reductase family protein n=1 Tax=Paenibacillus piri TaxID=2547395 RepID=A0A4R5KWQ1_9BACL|nr:arsenate reductase family protein [Paenibacillus piri]TDG00444.1 arsenate reductase family protein [Paenibacillus piri]